MKRIVEPELLDALAPDDPRAIRSRRDLRRVNAWMRNHAIMAGALKMAGNGIPPKQLVELGAGDGDFLLRVARPIARGWPGVAVTLLDRQNSVAPETLASFATLGWRAEAVVTDVFDWRQERADVVVANLFLHHFDDARLAGLLRLVSDRAGWFIAIEPHRFGLPQPCGQLLWLIGCSGVTRHDAVASIAAGFVGRELSALWPDQENWQLTERRAGLFSHLFVAQRITAGRKALNEHSIASFPKITKNRVLDVERFQTHGGAMLHGLPKDGCSEFNTATLTAKASHLESTAK